MSDLPDIDTLEMTIPENEDFTPLVTPGTKADQANQEIIDGENNVDTSTLLEGDDGEGVQSLVDLFATVTMLASEYMAERRGSHWRLKEHETEKLNGAFEKYMVEAFPDAKLTPGWSLIAVTGVVILPRAIEDKLGGMTLDEAAEHVNLSR